MVARTRARQRIEIGLRALEAALDDLPEIVEEWNDLPDGERVSWSLDWDHLMGSYLTLLDEYRHTQQKSNVQAQRYDTVRARLRSAMPHIEYLNLYRPPVSLE
jgi:hypothetical protein